MDFIFVVKGSASRFAPYISVFPADHDCTLAWGEEDMDHLEGVQQLADTKCHLVRLRLLSRCTWSQTVNDNIYHTLWPDQSAHPSKLLQGPQ
jgi:hypothetical protein